MTTTIAQNSKNTIKSNNEEANKRDEIGEGGICIERSSEQRGIRAKEKDRGGREE
jgi:hypothetical protein